MEIDFLVIGQLPPPIHGSNVMTDRFLNGLVKIGFNVTIVEKKFSARQNEITKVSIGKILKVPKIGLEIVIQILLKRPKLCFYFISVQPPAFYVDALFLFILRIFKIDYILYLHGKGLSSLSKRSKGLKKYIVDSTLSRAFGGLVLGDRLKSDIDPFIPHNHLFVLPNAVPDIDSKKIGSIVKFPIQILFLSNLIPSKGPMEFLKLAKIISKNVSDISFVLAGPHRSEQFYSEIMNFIRKENLKGIVKVPGAIYGKEKEELFRKSSIFVFPTYYDKETFGLVNIEAMQWGLPVISTNEGAIPEVVKHEINGYIVNPHDLDQLSDYTLKLIENEELRTKMGKAGRELYEKYFSVKAYERNLKKAVNFFIQKKLDIGKKSSLKGKSVRQITEDK
jgi:glycosyltransferase involved in cell wall biosynthesis